MKTDLYTKVLKIKNLDEIIEKFHTTIIDTNRGYNFFVDWKKVKKNIKKYHLEFNILNSLIRSENFKNDLKNILIKYPEVLPTIPILLAIREKKFKVITDFFTENEHIFKFDFTKRKLSQFEIEKFIEFFEKTGLEKFFKKLVDKSLIDYVTGIEVGMDTHARKNRSGNAMEIAIKPVIEKIVSELPGKNILLFQKKFNELKKYKIKVNPSLLNRKADFIIIKNSSKIINIEVNFYSGTGSKPQEIVDSYINRQNELKNFNFHFIWITDGDGWRGQKNQIKIGFEKIDYLLNLYFVKKGLLKEILWKI